MSALLKTSSRNKSKRRPGDPWISKNRVLNGGTSKSKRNCPIYRNPNFDTDETKLLIQLWGDPKTQRELITTHKKHVVIAQLSAKMEEYGYYRSPEEITTRIKNMKCFYNRLKKEMESTNNMDPSWRHFSQMDTIMTRPIFSVRPNEVPAPSLKYLLEQEQEKRKERKRKAEEEGSAISDSDEDLTDILAVPNSASNTKDDACNESTVIRTSTDIELELDENVSQSLEKSPENKRKMSNDENQQNKNEQTISDAEMAIKLEIESEQFQEYQGVENAEASKNNDANTKNTEELINTINISEDEDLLVPKIEPIDVDEEFVNAENKSTPTKTPTNQSFAQLADILKQPSKTQTIPSSTMIKFSMPTNSTSLTMTTSNSFMPTQSKISVVSPTILMPAQQIPTKSALTTNTDARQVRLPANFQALLAASGSRTTVANGNGMKFLLVNAADQRVPPLTTASLTSTLNAATNQPNIITNRSNIITNQSNVKIIQNTTQLQQQQQPQQMSQQNQLPQQKSQSDHLKPKETIKARQDYREQLKKRDLAGIKMALIKMLKVQDYANEIQSERLAIERERLQYERSIADRFLSIIEQQQKIQQQMQQQLQQQQQQHQQQQQQQLFLQQQPHIQLQQRPTTAQQMFATNSGQPTVTQNGQIMYPQKLLITTMVPNSAGQATAVSSSKVLTTSGFTNRTTTANSDLQLVVPKEEPQN